RNGCGTLEINGYGAFSLMGQWVFLGMFRLRSTWVCLLMAMNAACSVPSSTERLHADLEAMTAEAPGRFAVVFEDLSDPANRVAIREREVFHAASTMKTPVMAELWRQAAAGERSLDDSV